MTRAMAMIVVLLAARSGLAQGPFDTLARRIPSGANAIVLVNVDKIMQSQVAMGEGWRENLGKGARCGADDDPCSVQPSALGSSDRPGQHASRLGGGFRRSERRSVDGHRRSTKCWTRGRRGETAFGGTAQ